MKPTLDQIIGAIQHILTYLVGYAVGHGFFDSTAGGELGGALAVFVPFAIQFWWNRKAGSWFNTDQFIGGFQHLFTFAVAFGVGRHWFSQSDGMEIAGVALTLVTFAIQHQWNGGSVTTPPSASALLLLALIPLALSQPGCATLTGTSDPAQQIVAVERDVHDGVQLACSAELSAHPETRPYFLLASETLNTLTANGTPSVAQIEAEIGKVVPAQYRGVVNAVTQIAANKYQDWYTAHAAQPTTTQTGQYALGIIQAARDGLNAALASNQGANN
jgi:hypothetical protein